MINGADILGYSYPGGTQGWGRINMATTLIETNDHKIWAQDWDDDLALETGTYVSYNLTVNSDAEMRVNLVWVDEPAAENANPTLINDLDLKVVDPDGNIYKGNRFSNKVSSTGGQYDTKNNVEGTRWTSPDTGDWTVEVIGSNVPSGPQDWSLVVSGDISMSEPTMFFQDFGVKDLVISDDAPTEGDLVSV